MEGGGTSGVAQVDAIRNAARACVTLHLRASIFLRVYVRYQATGKTYKQRYAFSLRKIPGQCVRHGRLQHPR